MAKSVYARLSVSEITGVTQTQRTHTVTAGDTLPGIAAYYAPDLGYDSEFWRQIAEANGIDDIDALAIGTVLNIPFPQPTDT